jgi:hypothetical protein
MHFTTRENINKGVAQGQLFCACVLVHFVLKVKYIYLQGMLLRCTYYDSGKMIGNL